MVGGGPKVNSLRHRLLTSPHSARSDCLAAHRTEVTFSRSHRTGSGGKPLRRSGSPGIIGTMESASPRDHLDSDLLLGLGPERIVYMISKLERRIEERFPGAILANVCGRRSAIGSCMALKISLRSMPNICAA